MYLNLVLEFVPDTVYRVARAFHKKKEYMPILYVKLYAYQLCRSLAYIHGLGICHRDIKPQNLLIDHERGILKLCDFGSAKILKSGEPNVSYICSRYYRAPELIFGATFYTTTIGKFFFFFFEISYILSLEKKTQNQDQKLFYLLGLVIFNHVELEIVFLSSSVSFFLLLSFFKDVF